MRDSTRRITILNMRQNYTSDRDDWKTPTQHMHKRILSEWEITACFDVHNNRCTHASTSTERKAYAGCIFKWNLMLIAVFQVFQNFFSIVPIRYICVVTFLGHLFLSLSPSPFPFLWCTCAFCVWFPQSPSLSMLCRCFVCRI